MRERMRSPTGGQAAKEKPTMPATADAAAPKRMSSTDGVRVKKAVNQAQIDFERTGSIQSLARLRELQAQMS